jgi:predicted nucleic acid-binding protein
MSGCFADTYFFLALLFEKDEAHAQARTWVAKLVGRLYTSLWVLTEVADALAVPGRREQFPPLLQFLRASPLVTIVPAEQSLFDRGVRLYEERADKSWSLTDCISFIIMQDHGLRDALTGDHHFEQAGFNVLMK